MSVASIAGVASPLFFGFVYAASVGEAAVIPHPGTSFIAGATLLAGAIVGSRVASRARAAERRAG